jgi:spore coat protein U-like protein
MTFGNHVTSPGNVRQRSSTTVRIIANTMVALYISATVTPGVLQARKIENRISKRGSHHADYESQCEAESEQ